MWRSARLPLISLSWWDTLQDLAECSVLHSQVATAALGLREHYSLAQSASQAAPLDF